VTLNRRTCIARTRAGGVCGNAAILGATVCRLHGGSIGRVKRSAALRVAQEKATRAIEREGIAPLGEPVEMLRQLTAEAVQLKDYFADRLKALEELRYTAPGAGGEQLRSEVALYERALDRSQKFLHDLAKLGLDTRAVQIDEARIVLLVAVLEKVLASPELALDATRQARGRELLAEALDPQ